MNAPMAEKECLEWIHSGGGDALDLVRLADPKFEKRWKAMCMSMVGFLEAVKNPFPAAM